MDSPEIWFPHLGIQIDHLGRTAFSIFGLDVYWYGITMTLGIVAAFLYVLHDAKKTGQDPETYMDLVFFVVLAGIIGARLYYVFFSWDAYKHNLIKIFSLREGGLAIYGGIIGGAVAVAVFSKVKKINFFTLADTIMPGVLLGQMIGRCGNFINREAFGGYTDSLFAMRYLVSDVGYIHPDVLDKALSINNHLYIQVHPTFLYESLWNLALFALIMLLKRRGKFTRPSQITAVYFLGYGLGRAWIEGLRTDQLMILNMPVSQLLSVALVLLSAAYLIFHKRLPFFEKEH